jgi:hypothetical protein
VAVAATRGCETDVRGVLGVRERGLERRLRRINRLGLRQARALLQAWFVPLLWHRPRVYGEPQGNERRQLRKSLHVSSCCAFARRYKRAGFKPMWWPALWWSELVVRWLAGRSAAYWQVYYNAGCFYALRGKRERAWRCLNRALDSGGSAQLTTYIENDPDLRRLRKRKARWNALVKRSPTGTNRKPRWSIYEMAATLFLPVATVFAVAALLAAVRWPLAALVGAGGLVAWHYGIVFAYLHRAKVLYPLQSPNTESLVDRLRGLAARCARFVQQSGSAMRSRFRSRRA